MVDSKQKQSTGVFSKVTGVAKKLSHSGLGILNQFASTQNSVSNHSGVAQATSSKVQMAQYQDPRDVLKDHLPAMSRQMLGKHFNTVNRVAHFISPELNDQVSDYFFNHLNQVSNQLASVDAVLDEVGIRDLEELTQDVSRSQRIGQALAEQNKWLASVQGAFSGATGLVGTAIDIPVSLMFALRMIYQVGRSYGFDLQKEQDQEVVQYIFKQINLSLIAEKQTVLMALKALSNTLKNHDVSQLQGLLGSQSDIELLKRFLSNDQGELKWSWLNHFDSNHLLHKLSKLSPLASAGVGAVYSWRLVDDVHQKAQEVFSLARQYMLEHQDVLDPLSPIVAYENAILKLQSLAQQESVLQRKTQDEQQIETTAALTFVQNGDYVVPVMGQSEQVPNPVQMLDEVSSSEAELLKSQSSMDVRDADDQKTELNELAETVNENVEIEPSNHQQMVQPKVVKKKTLKSQRLTGDSTPEK